MKKKESKKAIIIIGPSASGKTDLALQLAKHPPVPPRRRSKGSVSIISADSRQIYKNLDYSTGKVSKEDKHTIEKKDKRWIIEGVNYWGYDVINASTREGEFNFKQFVNDLFEKHTNFYKNPPIIAGGTGFFISQLISKDFITEVEPNYELRDTLVDLSVEQLQDVLKSFGYKVETLNNSEKNNKQRLIRRIEIEQAKKQLESGVLESKNDRIIKTYKNSIFIGLKIKDSADRKTGYKLKIANWLKVNFEEIEKEVRWLIEKYPKSHLLNGFIFEEMKDYIKGNISKKETEEVITTKYLQYIKRQMTYFKKHFPKAVWFGNKEDAFNYVSNSLK